MLTFLSLASMAFSWKKGNGLQFSFGSSTALIEALVLLEPFVLFDAFDLPV